MTSKDILMKSIDYHDPNNQWENLQKELYFTLSRVDRVDSTRLTFDNVNNVFSHTSNGIRFHMFKNQCDSSVVEIKCDQQKWIKDYYTYLWGLPMNLRFDLNKLDENIDTLTFDTVERFRLKIPYEKDVWYFYISQDDFELVGLEFYYDKEEKKGERIFFKGNKMVDKIKMSNVRTWYEIENNKFEFLAEETLYATSALE